MQIPDILKKKLVQMTSVGIVTFVGGTGLGFILGKRHVYKKETEKEVESVQKAVEILRANKQKAYQTHTNSTLEVAQTLEFVQEEVPVVPIELRVCVRCGASEGKAHWVKNNFYYCSDCVDIARETNVLKGGLVDSEPPDDDDDDFETLVISNHDDGDWDYEAELSTRDPRAPYVIHQEEFINDEMGYHQETLSYYAGDDIMADTDDTPIYNYSGLMGELKFGHGSRDPNVVYIRNDAIHMEWEVLLNPGAFSEEVLGLALEKDNENDLRHSVQKFRRE